MRLTVQFEGVTEGSFSTRFKYIRQAALEGLKAGVSEASMMLVDEAKALVPVDTGNLRDHIHSELIEASDTRITVKVTPAYDEPNPWGFEPAYARRIEYGFVGRDSLGRNYNQAAQPYMRPAWDAKQEAARQIIEDDVWEAMTLAFQGRLR